MSGAITLLPLDAFMAWTRTYNFFHDILHSKILADIAQSFQFYLFRAYTMTTLYTDQNTLRF